MIIVCTFKSTNDIVTHSVAIFKGGKIVKQILNIKEDGLKTVLAAYNTHKDIYYRDVKSKASLKWH
ncbi:hypothetical protein Aci011_148 [Acinetobacter phage vB_AbaM_B09_Aci01-1]|uniref:Uncharacterized protein n=1 Tax=Acinetobacter phage vB_AbaM_B09_Aci01-1 TaxID=2315466 RepID=A0A386KJ45_9CAUD|nr:hypothetical protein HOU29_gp033 [Acinetobacter phage vB_AbaM_B09_Aci01-1]AYD85665.1 hypothetical protein Aci011_148 [Acinetobacter phage vB_AbaM_B09_Aci01-1]